MTRAQTAVMLSRMYGLPAGPDPGFSDVPHDAWYRQEVANLVQARITVGCNASGTLYCPKQATTRAHMATFLYRGSGPPRPAALPVLKWHSTGDSYSSGAGAGPYYDNTFGCSKSFSAFGHVAAGLLAQQGWHIDSHNGAEGITPDEGDSPTGTEIAFSACSGHHIEQFYFTHRHDEDPHGQLWPIGSERVDVLTMSFGGNDVGFNKIRDEFKSCLGEAWRIALGTVTERCQDFLPPTEEHLVTSFGNRISYLLYPRSGCSGLRYNDDLPDRYECELAIPGGRGGLDDFYYRVAEDTLTDDGLLYVALYPQLLADPEDWPQNECSIVPSPFMSLGRTAARSISKLTVKLNDTIKSAIDMANRRLGQTKIMHLDVYSLYRDGAHEVCGSGEAWLSDSGDAPLHPNAAGHAATGEALAQLIADTHPHADAVAAHQAAVAQHESAQRDYRGYLEELGPVVPRSVRLSPGTSAKGWEGCSTDPCKHFVIQLEGFAPGVYTVECWSGQAPGRRWYPENAGDVGRWTWPRSELWTTGGCYWGYPGETVWVVVDGVKSNEVIWPA